MTPCPPSAHPLAAWLSRASKCHWKPASRGPGAAWTGEMPEVLSCTARATAPGARRYPEVRHTTTTTLSAFRIRRASRRRKAGRERAEHVVDDDHVEVQIGNTASSSVPVDVQLPPSRRQAHSRSPPACDVASLPRHVEERPHAGAHVQQESSSLYRRTLSRSSRRWRRTVPALYVLVLHEVVVGFVDGGARDEVA
jgi:hypothetical protein